MRKLIRNCIMLAVMPMLLAAMMAVWQLARVWQTDYSFKGKLKMSTASGIFLIVLVIGIIIALRVAARLKQRISDHDQPLAYKPLVQLRVYIYVALLAIAITKGTLNAVDATFKGFPYWGLMKLMVVLPLLEAIFFRIKYGAMSNYVARASLWKRLKKKFTAKRDELKKGINPRSHEGRSSFQARGTASDERMASIKPQSAAIERPTPKKPEAKFSRNFLK